jgi:predicted metal-dependent phosphoesterase TrpH
MPGIDLHAHSTASDGTEDPAAVVRAARAAGLDVVALTDHDTTAGWQAAAAALPEGLVLVPGMELSCRHGTGADAVSLHLLGYLFDPDEPLLRDTRRRLRASRLDRGERMVAALAGDGVAISWEQVLGHAAGGSVGRPHVARALVEAGVVGSVEAAFTPDWLATGGRYFRDKEECPVIDAIRLVRGAGGVCVFAHPGAHRRGPVVSDDVIAAMADAGLTGLEVDHVDHDDATRQRLRALAAELGLLVTGGSDFHGSSKTVALGANLTEPEVYDQIVARAVGGQPLRG